MTEGQMWEMGGEGDGDDSQEWCVKEFLVWLRKLQRRSRPYETSSFSPNHSSSHGSYIYRHTMEYLFMHEHIRTCISLFMPAQMSVLTEESVYFLSN